jgi:hypothetical protein
MTAPISPKNLKLPLIAVLLRNRLVLVKVTRQAPD